MTAVPPQVLALDVDGVILDPDRGGAGHWTEALTRRHGITRVQLRESFFTRTWDDVVNGRLTIEHALADALADMGVAAEVDDVMACWFEADLVVYPETVRLARQAAEAGRRVVLATNQEHRRAALLEDRLGAMFPIDTVCYSAALGTQKHDPRFFELAGRQIGADPGSIVFVDDVEVNVARAAEAGWTAVHVVPGSSWHSAVAELLAIV
jgi:putative hydrolase of the HAD superfamily